MNVKKIIKGVVLAFLVSLILICVLAAVAYFSDIQDRTVSTLVLVISAVSVAFGAYFLARNISGGGLLNGLMLALIYFAVLLLVSILVNGSISFSQSNFLRLFAQLAAGALGGVLGINTAHKEA